MELRYLMKEIFAERVRVFLTIFAIAWGTLAIALMLGVGQGLLVTFTGFLNQMGQDLLVVNSGVTSERSQGLPSAWPVNLSNADVYVIRQLPAVQSATALYQTGLTLQFQQKNIASQNVDGVDAVFYPLHPVPMALGRFINTTDQTQHRAVVVLGQAVANKLFANASPLGQQVVLGGYPFRVIGVSKKYTQLFNFQNPDNQMVWIPQSVFLSMNPATTISTLVLRYRANSDMDSLKSQIRQVIADHHGVKVDDKTAISFFNNQQALTATTDFFRGLQVFVSIIGVVTLLIASLGIANVMYIAVRRAIPAIGIQLACGALPMDIIAQYIVESLLVTAFGGAIGLGLAELIMLGANQILAQVSLFGLTGFQMTLSWGLLVIIVVILGMVGLLAGVFPARQASRIQPVEALRHE